MKIAIVGAGAIGCLFGARLEQSGHSVLLVNNDPLAVAAMSKNGVRVRELSGKEIRTRPKVKTSLKIRDSPDLVLLTVKSYDTETASRDLRKSHSVNEILSIQNGLGNIETLSRFLPAQSILAGTTTEASLLTDYGQVVHTGRGVTRIGELKGRPTKRCREIRDVIRRAGFDIRMSLNIEGVIWSKAIVNSAINPITAIAHVLNGEVAHNFYFRELGLEVLKEGRKVASALGVTPTPNPISLFRQVIDLSKENMSSMLQDIEKRKRTEIQKLNGWISSAGKAAGIETPYTSALSRLVLGLEESNQLQRSGSLPA